MNTALKYISKDSPKQQNVLSLRFQPRRQTKSEWPVPLTVWHVLKQVRTYGPKASRVGREMNAIGVPTFPMRQKNTRLARLRKRQKQNTLIKQMGSLAKRTERATNRKTLFSLAMPRHEGNSS